MTIHVRAPTLAIHYRYATSRYLRSRWRKAKNKQQRRKREQGPTKTKSTNLNQYSLYPPSDRHASCLVGPSAAQPSSSNCLVPGGRAGGSARPAAPPARRTHVREARKKASSRGLATARSLAGTRHRSLAARSLTRTADSADSTSVAWLWLKSCKWYAPRGLISRPSPHPPPEEA